MRAQFVGYKLSRNYTKLSIWVFDSKTERLVLTSTERPNANLTRRERYDILAGSIEASGIPVPPYQPTKDQP